MVQIPRRGEKPAAPSSFFPRTNVLFYMETWKTTQVKEYRGRGKKGTQTGKTAQKKEGRKRSSPPPSALFTFPCLRKEEGAPHKKLSLFSLLELSSVQTTFFLAMAVEEKLQQPGRASLEAEERSPSSRKCQQTTFGRPKKRTSSSSISADLTSMTAKR